MINFFKDSVRELKHVVWPTREETKNYFLLVVITLLLFGVYLFVVSTVFTEGLFALKKAVSGTSVSSVDTWINPNDFIEKNVDTVDVLPEWEQFLPEEEVVVPEAEESAKDVIIPLENDSLNIEGVSVWEVKVGE